MHLLILLSPHSKNGFHLSQNYWNLSFYAPSIRVPLKFSRESHLHAARCGHAPNAAVPEAYKCRSLINQGLLWLGLEGQHIGRRKIKVLIEATAILCFWGVCHLPSADSATQCQLYKDLHCWNKRGVHGLKGSYGATATSANTICKAFFRRCRCAYWGIYSLDLVSNELVKMGKKKKGLLQHKELRWLYYRSHRIAGGDGQTDEELYICNSLFFLLSQIL